MQPDSEDEFASEAGSAEVDNEEEEVDSALGLDEQDSSDDSTSPGQPKIDAAKARTKLHHVAKTLRATAKRTKTNELQKLVKKLRDLKKKPSLQSQAELAEKELAALKSIDTALLAGRALVTKMVKARLLPRPAELEGAEEEDWLYLAMVRGDELLGEQVLTEPVVADGDRALERAKAKITSSKVLADEVGRYVEELKRLAGVEPGQKAEKEVAGKEKGKAKQQEDEEEEERDWSGSEDEEDSDDEDDRLPLVDDGEEDEEADAADEEELERIGKQKLKALGDLSQWDDMIGSDSEAGSFSDDEQHHSRKLTPQQHPDSSHDSSSGEEDYSSDSSSSSTSSSSSSASASRPRKRKSSAQDSTSRKKSKSSSSSTFLPSLSTGFIPGRSDDEWSDAEADLADRDLSELKSGAKKERKNRMGQRARKALAEKKYGKNANHIKMREKQRSVKREREGQQNGAAIGGRQRPPAFQAPTKVDGGWGGKVAPLPKQPKVPRRENFVPREPVVPVTEVKGKSEAKAGKGGDSKAQEMHPSWIAKQKQKELLAQVKPEGKRIVFD